MPRPQTSALPKGKVFELPSAQLTAAAHTQVIASLMAQGEISELDRGTIKKLKARLETAKNIPELTGLVQKIREEEVDQTIRVALETAADILKDGDKSIYHPSHWSTRSQKDSLKIAIAGVMGAVSGVAAAVHHGRESQIEVTQIDIINSAVSGAIAATAAEAGLVPVI